MKYFGIRRVRVLENTMVIFFFSAIFVVLILQFFTRYVLNNSFGWTEEVARMLLICLCFVGAVVNAREKSEISLEFLHHRLKEWWRIRLAVMVRIITASLYFLLALIMFYYFTKSRQYLSSIVFPKKYIVGVVAVSCTLMGIHATIDSIKLIRVMRQGVR